MSASRKKTRDGMNAYRDADLHALGLRAHPDQANHEPAFKPGDIVSLRSGGDPMTVEVVLPWHRVHPAIGYVCVWMRDGELRREELSEAALVLATRRNDPSPGPRAGT